MTSVLIVDDDDSFRKTIGRDLGNQGFEVALASGVDEALAALSAKPIDVLLTDLRMPDADGIDLLAQVREVSARTRAILMSGFATARDYQRAIECGAVRVLCKPFTSSELMQAIRQAVDCETGFRGNIHGLSLIDLLQMFHYARRSVAIVVDSWAPGHLFLDEGRIIHAIYRELTGEQALRAILAMPAGSLRTMVLPDGTPCSITRDFSTLLLDSLRTIDEATAGSGEWDLSSLADDPIPVRSPLAPLRELEGCTAACLVDTESGVVLGSEIADADAELQLAAAGYAEMFRRERATVAALALDDHLEDVLITLGREYHILRAVAVRPSLCIYVVIDRKVGNLGMARFALAAAEAAFDA
ncbi:MAG: response regulator [Kofleriaceae bacterium]